MPNILITNHCMRKCTFCFARSRIGRSADTKKSRHMSLENIHKVMDFLEKTNDCQLRLLGGEPTLHPEFNRIVKEGLERNFHVHIFSNCMMPDRVVNYLKTLPDKDVSILANVSAQESDTREMKERVERTLEQLGEKITVGITVPSPQFEYKFLFDMINKYKLRRRIRVGIAQPIVGTSNEFLRPSMYREVGTAIVKMALDSYAQDILIGFDCGLTLCMFSEMEIGTLAKKSEGFTMLCDPIIDIGPELDVWNCFPLSEVLNTKLDMFKTINEITAFYNKRLRPYRDFGCMSECSSCVHLKHRICKAGCLAHAISSFNKLPPKTVDAI